MRGEVLSPAGIAGVFDNLATGGGQILSGRLSGREVFSLDGGALALRALGTATSVGGFNSGALGQTASAFNSDPLVNAAVAQTFQWRAEPVNSNTVNPSGKLSLLFGSGTTAPAATGLSINASGIISFATGQTFPSAGGISVASDLLIRDFLLSVFLDPCLREV